MTLSSFAIINHRQGGDSQRLLRKIEGLFARHETEFQRARELARKAAEIIARIDPLIERHTFSVCPRCTEVCCANRHAYHTHEDVIYLRALGEEVPSYDLRIDNEDPCQFIGEQGCSISRILRPHRCNSYFCTPLLEQMENGDVREYRGIVESMKELTRTRMAMLQAFAETAAKLAPEE
jgi:epoxyqueuosine reductase QueG